MSTEKTNPKRKHHELPRLYLQGFCEYPKASYVWIYERGKSYEPGIKKGKYNPYRCGLRDIKIAQPDRYTWVKPDGTRDSETYENLLEKIEETAITVLRKIRSQEPISAQEKVIFAGYIENIHRRTSEHQRQITQILDNIQHSTNWVQNPVHFALNGQFGTARKHYEALKYLASDDGKNKLFLDSIALNNLPRMHQTLMSMRWAFYVAESASFFVTSNTPVIIVGGGLSVSPLLFPISKNVVLIATHDERTDLEYINISSDETLIINYYTICRALEVYAPKPESWIWDILENGLKMTIDQSMASRKLFQ